MTNPTEDGGMSDLEMTKACAKATGLLIADYAFPARPLFGFWCSDIGELFSYNPLRNDADAMALVKRFKLAITPPDDCVDWCVFDINDDATQAFGPDLNRAIVECVAKMQRAKS